MDSEQKHCEEHKASEFNLNLLALDEATLSYKLQRQQNWFATMFLFLVFTLTCPLSPFYTFTFPAQDDISGLASNSGDASLVWTCFSRERANFYQATLNKRSTLSLSAYFVYHFKPIILTWLPSEQKTPKLSCYSVCCFQTQLFELETGNKETHH